ncbi:uncharacterized protein DS421_4g121140 [Arachis hypogaea]|nr:uncharacterized protein DS421_4g121140 [Arachis hypogaea]
MPAGGTEDAGVTEFGDGYEEETLGWFWWLLVVVDVVGKVGRRNQELEVGSKAKDWLFFEEMLWIPWRKNHGFLLLLWLLEKETEEIMECHCLQTVEERIKVGIGRKERISSMRSVLRWLTSVMDQGGGGRRTQQKEREGKWG